MFDILISLGMNLLEFWIFILLMQYVCSAHMKLNTKNIFILSGISISFSLLSFILDSYTPIPYASLICIPFAVLVSVLVSSFKWTDFFLFIPAFAIYFILDFIPEKILLILIPSLNGKFLFTGSNLTITALLSDVLLLFLLLMLRWVLTKHKTVMHFRFKEALGSVGLVFFSFIDVMLLLSLDRENMRTGIYYVWVFIFVGMLVCGIVYYLYSLASARARLAGKMNAEKEITYLKLKLESLQDIKENEEHVQKMRHDLGNHLLLIENLCEEGRYDEIKKYTEELHENIALPGNAFLSGSKTADMIIRNKRKRAEESSIAFTFNGTLEQLEYMKKPDLVSLLGNAYDNALEACQNVDKPYIKTNARTTRNYTVIQITNPVESKVTIRGGKLLTTKEDKALHGYGTQIMKDIARKYSGSCTFTSTAEEFTVKITLPTSK